MKRHLYLVIVLGVFACSGNKRQVFDIAGMESSPFIGCWENISANDTVQNISLRIGGQGDSLFLAFYWERQKPFYMSGNPLEDSKGYVIPQACIPVPKNGNMLLGGMVNQYFSVFYNYPKNEYYPIILELISYDTLTFKIDGEVNYWPDSAVLVRKDNKNPVFSTEVIDLYKEDYLVADADVAVVNNFDVAGMEPSPFIGQWSWEKNDSWQNFSINISAEGDSLLLAVDGVFLGGRRIQLSESNSDGGTFEQTRLFAPKWGHSAVGRFCTDTDCEVALELFSNNTLLFKTEKPIGYLPDSAVMVRTSNENPVLK